MLHKFNLLMDERQRLPRVWFAGCRSKQVSGSRGCYTQTLEADDIIGKPCLGVLLQHVQHNDVLDLLAAIAMRKEVGEVEQCYEAKIPSK
jgi:hypothetical protein